MLKDVATSDAFIAKLLEIHEAFPPGERYMLGIHRSDYMLHDPYGNDAKCKQVEMNTVASSFGGLSSRVSELHRQMLRRFTRTCAANLRGP